MHLKRKKTAFLENYFHRGEYSDMGKYIGIDLGTTFSCMAFINDSGQPEIIPNSEGDNLSLIHI